MHRDPFVENPTLFVRIFAVVEESILSSNRLGWSWQDEAVAEASLQQE